MSLGLVACGDDDSGGEGGGDAGAGLSGEPIRLMGIEAYTSPMTGADETDSLAAAEARARAVNESGGIDGRPIEILSCDTESDANKAADCAREAVEEGVVGVFGLDATNQDSAYPILNEANIAAVGGRLGGNEAATSPNSFPFFGGISAEFSAVAELFARAGVERFGVILPDLPDVQEGVESLMRSAQVSGVEVGEIVFLPLDTADFSAGAATALSGDAEGVLAFWPGPNQATVLRTVRQRDPDATLAAFGVFLSDPVLEALGPDAEGLLVLATTRPSTDPSPGIDMFNADMDDYASEDNSRGDGPVNQWADVWTFERIFRDLDTVNPQTVLDALNDLTDFDMGGIIPNYTTTEPGPLPAFPRMFNPSHALLRIEGNERVPLDPDELFYDPFAEAPRN